MYVYVCICMYMYVYACICTYNTTRKHSLINKYNKKYRYTYLDLPYGTYFCRCSKTLYRIVTVLAEKCRSWKKMPLWEIVRARGRVLSPFGRAFSPQKIGFGINISEEILVCPKRSFLCKTYLLSKRQKLSTFWRGRYNILYIYIWYIYHHIPTHSIAVFQHHIFTTDSTSRGCTSPEIHQTTPQQQLSATPHIKEKHKTALWFWAAVHLYSGYLTVRYGKSPCY